MSPKNWPSNLIYNNIQSYIGFKNLKKEYNTGIEIGEHSVIGAGSTVLNNISNNVVAFGTPAKKIRERNRGEKYL